MKEVCFFVFITGRVTWEHLKMVFVILRVILGSMIVMIAPTEASESQPNEKLTIPLL